MKYFFTKKYLFHCAFIFATAITPFISNAQNLKINDFVLFGGSGSCAGSGCGVQIATSTSIQGGSIGSYTLVKTTGNLTFTGNIYSGGNVVLANNNVISGKITAANTNNISGTVVSIGSSASIGGNIDAKGNIVVSGGTISGTVTHPAGTTYTGPAPKGGNITGIPNLPVMPVLPVVTSFPAAGTTDISSTQKLTPGAYGNVTLGNNQTLTLSGTGIYIFKSIKNSGNNSFIFDFKNSATGAIKIYVLGDVDLNKVNASTINGGDATRIYAETHGNGTTSSSGNISWNIANGSSGSGSIVKWLGTVWAPYGGISIGSGTGQSNYTGAFYSGVQVNVQSGVSISYAPFIQCNTPVANAGSDKVLDCSTSSVQLDGTASTPNLQYSWATVNNGRIISGANTLTPTVDAVGTYVLTVTDPNGGCTATDTVLVTFSRCILPYYPPPPGGKIRNLIGAELNSLYENFGFVSDTAQNIFILKHDSVMIEVISLIGQYQTLLALLQTAPYGMTDLVNNGPNSLIITGKYPIKNLLKLDSLPNLIDYCRPVFPSISNAGVVTSQGDTAMLSYFVRNGYDLSGQGVKVGVLSNSYNTIAGNPAQTDVLNGDLPGIGNPDNPNPVEVLQDYPFGRLSDEGRAMLQIVHDVAPKAKLAFRTGFINSGDFAQGIKQLQQDSCNIIVDDVTYITEPFFQDGVVAQAVDSVAAKGVAYFSAAGNYGNQSYEGIFNPSPAPFGITGTAHNFSNGDIYQTITLTPGTYTAVLQWQDDIYSTGQTQNGTVNDLDFYLTDNNGNALFGFNRNNIGADPIEVLPFTVTQNTQTNIVIIRASGTGNVRFKYVFFRGNGIVSKYNSGNSTIVGQANAAGAMAVGAVLYKNTPAFGVNPPTIASFSSTGGTPVNGIVRNKPEFCAPNGGNTTVYLGGQNIDGDAFPNFFGTSSAAPHAAGVAALLIQGKKKYSNINISPDSVRSLLERTALDMGTPGFDFVTGYGFVQADAAMRTFATPKPVITKLVLSDTTIKPGTQPVNVTVQGNYLDPNSKVLFRGAPITTTPISSTAVSAVIPSFIGNPAIQVYTAPISSSGIDGGYSDSLYFFSPVKKIITITADNKTKKYGEQIPAFSSSILVDSIPLEKTGLTLRQLGLDTINYTTTAVNSSNVGIYAIKPAMKNFAPNDTTLIALLETYKYVFNNGLLAIKKMPLVITPRDTTLTYGNKINGINFNYNYGDSLIAIADRSTFLNSLQTNYQANLVNNAVGLVDSRALVNGRALVNADLSNLSFLVSARALVNSRALVNTRALVNGTTVNDTTNIVDVATASVFNYQADSANTTLVSARALVNSRALVNARALVNGGALVNSRALVNGAALVNSSTVGDTSNSNVAVIIDQTDVNAPSNDTLSVFKSLNLITGITAGIHAIVPGALLSDNFDISYGLGNLTILPAPLTVRADSTTISYGAPSTAFTSKISGYQFQDNADSVFPGGISYTLLNSGGSVISATNIPAGVFKIMPSGALVQPPNYTVQYINGLLTVNKALLAAKAVDTFRVYGNNNPVFRIAYTGFANGDGPSNITQPLASTTATLTSGVGIYPITLSGGSASNYTIVNTGGNLTISPAPLIVKADNKTITDDDALPKFTSTITGFKNNDAGTIVSGPVYKVSPTYYKEHPGTYTITPSALVLKVPGNYTISYVAGNLYVTEGDENYTKNPKKIQSAVLSASIPVQNFISLDNIAATNTLTAQPMTTYQNQGKENEMAQLKNASLDNIESILPLSASIYPNPTNGRIVIQVNNAIISANGANGIVINDITGKNYNPKSVRKIDNNQLELDISNLESGVYFIRIKIDRTFKTFKIIKL